MGFVIGNKSCAVLLKAYCLCGFEHLLKPFSWQKCPSFIVFVINFTEMPLAHRYVVSLFSSRKHIAIDCDIWCNLNVRVSGLFSKVKTENYLEMDRQQHHTMRFKLFEIRTPKGKLYKTCSKIYRTTLCVGEIHLFNRYKYKNTL